MLCRSGQESGEVRKFSDKQHPPPYSAINHPLKLPTRTNQDKKDDIKAGVKSTALRFGPNPIPWLSLFSTTTIGFLTLAGVANAQGPLFYAISVGGAAAHLVWQLATLRVNDPRDAAKKFRSNAGLGVIVLLGIGADLAWSRWGRREGEEEAPRERMVVLGVCDA
ncbi:hypothetical protein BDK51DRAFT_52805 [Blyttiomyces helicus]|uniref:Uncharacterized protein n=1 Tax=Blyttiomyces helicus TaxID=388810 RepID=A0A4P9W8N9_9FUNG|nr:hypothetical protein BDK51DRAFT_52805 [Blyttiomyces helicus]|eukprot:RKO87160.1 hypothetical protein BDK51DRAFT_52805 [Blyttiomyces helicus]